MRILSTDDYIKESEEFFKKNADYYKKLVAINKEENSYYNDPNEDLDPAITEKYDNLRKALKDEYFPYDSIYHADFACYITKDNIHKLMSADKSVKKIFLKEMKLVGKKVQSEASFSTYGILKALAVSVDDYYYVIQDEQTNEERWMSAVCGIYPFNIWEHRCWRVVTTPNDKGYI